MFIYNRVPKKIKWQTKMEVKFDTNNLLCIYFPIAALSGSKDLIFLKFASAKKSQNMCYTDHNGI